MRFDNNKISQSLAILGLKGQGLTMKDVKAGYLKAMLKYHPDVNPAGHKMAQVINSAWDFLNRIKDGEGLNGPFGTNEDQQEDYTGKLSDALKAILDLPNIEIEICGTWVWVSGDTKAHRTILKDQGFRYAPKKQMWSMAPDGYVKRFRKNSTMDEIRDTYGSQKVKGRSKGTFIAGQKASAWQRAKA